MEPAPDYSQRDEAGFVSGGLMEEIRAFFDATDPGSFKTTLFNILLAYGGQYHYSAGEPVEVVEALDRLGGLLACVKSRASLSEAPPAGNNSVGLAEEPSCNASPGNVQSNPTDVLARFFDDGRYRDIEGTLRSIRFFALCRQSGMEDGAAIDTLRFYHDVTTLIDACDSIRKTSAGA